MVIKGPDLIAINSNSNVLNLVEGNMSAEWNCPSLLPLDSMPLQLVLTLCKSVDW
jgi:hypothetical protein